MTIRFDEDARFDLSGVQAILLTSANGARALAAAAPDAAARRLPVLAVGCATARAARDAGFRCRDGGGRRRGRAGRARHG